jgi:hypothetical protein
MSQKTLDVVRGIAQAAANAYDGAHDANGEPIKLGLKREEGNPITDSRVVINSTFSDIVKFLKKEYKNITGNALSLSEDGEPDIMIQKTSKVRVWCQATKAYKIGNLDGVVDRLEPSEDRLDSSFREFLGLGGLGKKAENKNQRAPQK